MLKKTIKINHKNREWTGTVIEYRFFGMLIYKKTLSVPTEKLNEFVWHI